VSGPSSEDLEAVLQDALARPLSWRERLIAWLMSRVTGVTGREGTAGGYWGGVTFWDVVKAAAARAGQAAVGMFLRR
jgi:hypothetical protein